MMSGIVVLCGVARSWAGCAGRIASAAAAIASDAIGDACVLAPAPCRIAGQIRRNRGMKRLACLLAAWGTLCAFSAVADTYYLDSVAGNDAATGLSERDAWKTLGRASGVAYAAGDRLLLKRGCVFAGTLALRASGSAAAPVLVDAYGTGALPVLDGKGEVAALALEGVEQRRARK